MFNIKFAEICGNIYITGSYIDQIAKSDINNVSNQSKENQKTRDNNSYHITFLHKSELNNLNVQETIDELNILYSSEHLLHMGLGSVSDNNNICYYQLVYFPEGQKWIQNKLNNYDRNPYFHITVGFNKNDIHDKTKDFNTILKDTIKLNNITNFVNKITNPDDIKSWLTHIDSSNCPNIICRLIDLLCDQKNYAEVISYITTENQITNNIKYQFKLMICYKKLDLFDDQLVIINYILNNFKPNNDQTNLLLTEKLRVIEKLTAIDKIIPDEKIELKLNNHQKIKMPNYTSWIIPAYIGGCGIITKNDQIKAFESYNIGLIISLKEEPLNKKILENTNINYKHFYVEDHQPASLKQIIEIVDLMEQTIINGKGVFVHCLGGKGRTGLILTCYIAKNGFNRFPSGNCPTYYATEALNMMRKLRSKCIETNSQEDALKEYVVYLSKDHIPKIVPLSGSPQLIILVGLPGSGKSYFTKHLSDHFYVVSQDEIGSRSKCEELLGVYIKKGSVILDRCNVEAHERYLWYNLAFSPKNCMCVFFDVDPDICKNRVMNRVGHETIEYGSKSGANIIDGFHKKMEQPMLNKEKYFTELFTVKTPNDVANLLKSRFNKQVIQDNDTNYIITKELSQHSNKNYFVNSIVIINKKPNNLISMSFEDYKPISDSLNLDKYFADNYADLFNILGDQQCVMYGECDKDFDKNFVCYYMFNKFTNKVYSYHKLKEILSQTNVKIVPILYEGMIRDFNEYKKFGNALVRIDDSEYNLFRCFI